MASNGTPSSAPHPRIKYVALGALVLLGLGDAGVLLFTHHPAAPPPPPPAAANAPAAAASGPPAPSFDVVRVDTQGDAVFAGRAAPGATVIIKDNGTVVGTITADSQGAFVLVPTTPLPPGAQEVTLSETLANGQTLTSTSTAELNVPNGAGQALAVLSGPNGSTVLSGQGPQPGTLGIGAVDYDTQGHAIFAGTAPAGATVNLSLGGKAIGNAIAGADGRWHIVAATPAGSGTLALSATTVQGAALPGVSAPFAPESLSYALASGHVVIVPGDNLWMIARHVYGHGIMYTLIYSANAHQIQNPNLIYPGQKFALPKPKGQN